MIATKTIAKYTFLEAIRNKLPVLLLVIVTLLWGIAGFVGELAITETSQIQVSILGFLTRFFAALLMILLVSSSCIREFNDKTISILLSLPYQRYQYYLGKLTGFALLSLAIGLIFSIPIVSYSGFSQSVIWCLSLSLELIIVSSVTLLFVLSLGNMTSAFAITVAFYLLSRSIETVIVISKSPIMEDHSLLRVFTDKMILAIAYLLPGLDQFAVSEWLVYGGATIMDLWRNLLHAGIYLAFIAFVTLADFYRKNI